MAIIILGVDFLNSFIVQGKPFGKQRPRVTTKGRYAHAYTPTETAEYEEKVRVAYKEQCNEYYSKDKAIGLTILAIFEPSKSDSKRVREDKLLGKIQPMKKPDWDNIGKIICDALNGVAWEDDKQVISATVLKQYGEAAAVIVGITEIGD